MKVGFSTSVIQRGKTGIAQYVFALVRALQEQPGDCRLTLFVLEEDLPLFDFARASATLVPVSECHRPAVKNILWHQAVLPGLVRQHQLDLLHIPSYRRLLWQKPCPLVATIHDLAPFHLKKKYDPARQFYGQVVVRRLAHRQDAIIAISRNTANDIVRFFGVPESRIQVIHNGLEHDRFFPGPKDAARAWARDRFGLDVPFFLYVARLEHPAKNHWRLIEAFNRFKQGTQSKWKLVFAGSDWHGAEEIHRAIAASPSKNEIHSLGFVTDADLPQLYQAAEVFVYPSMYEGFGMPPVEAMASGCPVISSDRGSLGEVVGDAARLVNPESVEDLEKALKELATSEDARQNYRKKGLVQAGRFNWQITARETLAVYQRVLVKPAANR